MAAIRHTLQRDVFQPNDERLVGVVYVAKASKKKKTSFLCAAVSTDAPRTVGLYQVKKSDKDTYKKRVSWPLRQLKLVDGKSEEKATAEFDLHFDRVYKWVASNVQEKYTFISCLWKLCCQSSPLQKPSFVHIPKEILEEHVPIVGAGTSPHPLGMETTMMETEDYQALTQREESDLEKLMVQCEFAICNAEVFTEQLARELSELDATNIHTIMASEQRVQGLMQMIQAAIDEATKLEQRLDAYDNLLKNVRDTVLQMEEKDTMIQIQNANNRKLLEELENTISQLDLDSEQQAQLLDGDLRTPEGISAAIAAAKTLQDALNASIHPSLMRMAAVQEQKKLLEKLRHKFTMRLFHHLNNLFIHLGNERGENLSFFSSELNLPSHQACHSELLPYSSLIHWLKTNDSQNYLQLTKVYTSCFSKLYEKEIKWFFELVKEKISLKMSSTDKEKKGRMMASNQELNAKGVSKPRSSSLLGMEAEHFGSDLDLSERQMFDKSLEKMLSVLEPICFAEQEFCIQFFCLTSDIHPSVSQMSQLGVVSPTPSTVSIATVASEDALLLSTKKEKHIHGEVRRMMGELFSVLEPELKSFIEYYDKIDGFYSMYLLVRFSQHVMPAQDTGSFLSMTLASILVHVKRNFDRFMQMQLKSIEEAKVSKKSKCGILPFITNFEDFAQQAESIFRGSDRRGDLDKWYIKLVRAMSEAITRIAVEHQKSPQEVIMMENFHHLFTLLYQLKIPCLDNERKEAKHKYNEALQAYVTHYFGRPLEKLNLFFEGVQNKVAQGVKEEEVGYQLAFSKQELRKVIREYPGKEVKKGLESLYKKVEKHLCEEENLLQVVWHSMQDEFIRQYKYIEGLIERCYPGSMITLEFSINDILEFFSDIARSH